MSNRQSIWTMVMEIIGSICSSTGILAGTTTNRPIYWVMMMIMVAWLGILAKCRNIQYKYCCSTHATSHRKYWLSTSISTQPNSSTSTNNMIMMINNMGTPLFKSATQLTIISGSVGIPRPIIRSYGAGRPWTMTCTCSELTIGWGLMYRRNQTPAMIIHSSSSP